MSAERQGGLAAWAPRALPERPSLTPEQELAVALRHLDDIGWCENLTGHITSQITADEMLVNPWGYWWAEATASRMLRIDPDGAVTHGDLDVTPAVHIHTELHRRRPDAAVVIHNHPPYATTLAAMGELPDLLHQNSAIAHDDLVLVEDYDGEVDQPHLGAELADRIGDAAIALLVSHGVIVTAPTMAQAVYTSVLFERTCMLHWQVLAAGGKSRPISPAFLTQVKASLIERAAPVYWGGVTRELVDAEPEVLL